MKKTLIPFLAWSVIFFIINYYNGLYINDKIDLGFFLEQLINTKVMPVYWFFPVLFIIYLSIPILSEIKTKDVWLYFIIVSFLINSFIPMILELFRMEHGGFVPFHIGAGYLIYPIIGYYLSAYNLSQKHTKYLYFFGG